MGDLPVLSCQLQSRRSEKGENLPVASRVRAAITGNYSFWRSRGWNCQRLRRGRLGKKRPERRRNTERNEQLQLKPLPKIKDHIFHQIFKPSRDVTNEAQFVWLFWNYTLVFRMQARTHQTAAPFLGFKFCPLLLSILPEVLSNHSNMIWN